MATYAIGDVQGCFEALERLLKTIEFNPAQDHLWFAGDLVNRGPQSLDVLRFIKKLEHRAKCVLGNHDLHLLAVHFTHAKTKTSDTLNEILTAPDCDELLDWLRHQPLIVLDEARNWCMSHAGIPPMWSVRKAQRLAQEVEVVLQGNDCTTFFQNMYGNQPNLWNNNLRGFDRLRTIVNYFTRMRFLGPNYELDLISKEGLDSAPIGFKPWFESTERKNAKNRLLFGHWAALEGNVSTENVYALDTGCVWGGRLSALRLDDSAWFHVPAQPHSI